ncbi:MAG: WecB/TagA/CpsF family glycosyltransferase [Defluviitaleaceae bacterium]|nr:WecB/TagA/CpsF family glycosyltransferase [Defluviitaleaceae bacterium]
MKIVEILGIPFNSMAFEEAIDLLESYLEEHQNHIVVTPNPEGVMQARRNPAFSEALLGADLRLADGIGIVLASRYLGNAIPERVRGVDTIFTLLERLNKKDRKTTAFFLGGAPGVADKAKAEMEHRFPNFSVVGHHHGFFTPEEEPAILEELNRLRPDIMLVCTGMPRAEIWANTHREIPARITLCLGGTMDIMAGVVKLAPPLFRKLGLEWLYRLLSQPSRAKRMLDIPRFMWAVVRHSRRSK